MLSQIIKPCQNAKDKRDSKYIIVVVFMILLSDRFLVDTKSKIGMRK